MGKGFLSNKYRAMALDLLYNFVSGLYLEHLWPDLKEFISGKGGLVL